MAFQYIDSNGENVFLMAPALGLISQNDLHLLFNRPSQRILAKPSPNHCDIGPNICLYFFALVFFSSVAAAAGVTAGAAAGAGVSSSPPVPNNAAFFSATRS